MWKNAALENVHLEMMVVPSFLITRSVSILYQFCYKINIINVILQINNCFIYSELLIKLLDNLWLKNIETVVQSLNNSAYEKSISF